jgi:dipeptidyl aminopeptidase/acylaminoacyl peptidase
MPTAVRAWVPAFALMCAGISPLAAQGTAADYERARELPARWQKLARPFRPQWHWLPDGGGLWWKQPGRGPAEYVAVHADGRILRAATAAELGVAPADERLEPQREWGPSSRSDEATTITFVNALSRPVRLFWVDPEGQPKAYGELAPGAKRDMSTYSGHVWLCDFAADDLAGVFVAQPTPGRAELNPASVERAKARRPRGERPPRARELFVRDGNVFLRRDGNEVALSTDGSAADPYHEPRHRSPDGKHALGFQIEPPAPHPVTLVESTPKDQVQPKVHTFDYSKPGDRIARPRPRLFDLQGGKQIPVDDAPFADAWSIDRVHWAKDGSEVFVLHNQRGHQRLAVLAIDAVTGAVRTVLEERSATFVDYSQKTVLHWLGDRSEFLWASERDGWNHLYRVNAKTGAIVPLTRGEWVVRRLEHVDVEAGEVWFAACGIHPGQDPYHEHLARVRLDGTGLAVLTDGDGTHEWTFSPDRTLFVDRWSRVDQPWVTELRRTRDGARIAELGREDPAELLAAGFRPPQRFVAKGRDGATDIHGIVILPSTFDPARSHPIVEAIYAGPHDHHVPKSWGLGLRQRSIAELGFAVVQIDGMGTNWRSKAFHDVCWRNLKDAGFPDRIAWIRALAAATPGLDATRVGIFGGSAGGQNALGALLHHGDFYRAAAADCGCHDNRMDKIWWNEAWMGYPVGPWYADCSNVTHAGKLQGKLLLTVGELDRNVDPASTRQVVAALIAAGKDFDYVEVPGGGHGVGESPYLARRRQDFFVRHLLGVEPSR